MSIELTTDLKTFVFGMFKNINYVPYTYTSKYRVIHWNSNDGPIFNTLKEAKKYASSYALTSVHEEIFID